MSIEALVIDLIEGRKKSFFLLNTLHLFSYLYCFAASLRNFFYDKGFLKQETSSLPVISIGNLVAGGTGKTPFTQKLISAVSQKEREIAILTRGYRSKAESQNILTSSGRGPLVTADICGDEPYWLAKHTAASIWTGKDRIKSLQKAISSGARAVFLEDGFGHLKIERDVDIVLLNAEDLWGKGYFLPRGYLRESPKRLSRADFIVVTRCKPNSSKEKIIEEIRRFSKAPVLGLFSSYELKQEVEGKKVGAFSGIAKPESFYRSLKSCGTSIVKEMTFPDHKAPSFEVLSNFASECKRLGAEYLICTEKDKVKIESICQLDLPIEVLKMNFEVAWNENVWKEMVQSIQTRL